MRVNFDASKAEKDPRYKRLRFATGLPKPFMYGCCLMVWTACYEQRSPVISRAQLDAEAELAGFADHLIACDLALDLGGGMVHVKGVEERIKYLKDQSERSHQAVEAKRAKARLAHQTVEQTVDPWVNQTVDQTDNRLVQNQPLGQPNGSPNGQPNPQPSDLSVLSDSERTLPRDPGSTESAVVDRAIATGIAMIDRFADVAQALWSYRNERRAEIAPKCPGSGRGPPAMPPNNDGGPGDDLRKLIRGMRSAGDSWADIEAKIRDGIDCSAAKAERDLNCEHFALCFRGDEFARHAETSAEEIAKTPPSAMARGDAKRRRDALARAGPFDRPKPDAEYRPPIRKL